nr:hypothetical protein [Nostoc sp. DedQUE02]
MFIFSDRGHHLKNKELRSGVKRQGSRGQGEGGAGEELMPNAHLP